VKGPFSKGTHSIWRRIERLSFILGLVSLVAACAPNETKPTPEPPPPEPEPVSQCPTVPAKDLERQALELLDAGETATAREQLECALKSSPGSTMATLLIEQLDADPVASLGSRHFMYTVQSNDTLSKIAQKYLGSALKFVILARYNDIDVPADLVAGQAIKIPGKKPPEPAVPKPPPPGPTNPESINPESTAAEPTPPASTTNEPVDRPEAEELRAQATAMEQRGDLEKAFELMSRAVEADPSLENAEVDLARIRRSLISKLEGDAYDQELYGEPQKAADIWRKVLEIDPANIPAQLALKRLTD
jgi:tetratricopeptide (TPR) repeat protein